jgi:hypothetical protein
MLFWLSWGLQGLGGATQGLATPDMAYYSGGVFGPRLLHLVRDRDGLQRQPKTRGSRIRRESKMWETAKLLVDIAVKAQMTIYDVDRETARDWVVRAAEASEGRG